MFNKLKWHDKTIIAGIAIFTLLNPLAGQYIIQGIIWGYESLIILSDYFMTIGLTLMVVGVVGSKINTKQAYNAKLAKLSTGKAGKYIETN